MTTALMATVRCLSKHAIQLPHTLRQIAIRCFNHQMIVIDHQTIGMTDPIKVFNDPTKKTRPKISRNLSRSMSSSILMGLVMGLILAIVML